MRRMSKQRRAVRETLRRPTETELRVLAALIDCHVAMRPERRYLGSYAATIAIHVQRSVPTVRKALQAWARRGLVFGRGPQGSWPTQWVVGETRRGRRDWGLG